MNLEVGTMVNKQCELDFYCFIRDVMYLATWDKEKEQEQIFFKEDSGQICPIEKSRAKEILFENMMREELVYYNVGEDREQYQAFRLLCRVKKEDVSYNIVQSNIYQRTSFVIIEEKEESMIRFVLTKETVYEEMKQLYGRLVCGEMRCLKNWLMMPLEEEASEIINFSKEGNTTTIHIKIEPDIPELLCVWLQHQTIILFSQWQQNILVAKLQQGQYIAIKNKNTVNKLMLRYQQILKNNKKYHIYDITYSEEIGTWRFAF